MNKKVPESPFADLRKRAQDLLSEGRKSGAAQSAFDADCLLHELTTHQIELELQNEDLRKTQEGLEQSRSRFCNLYDFAPVGYLTVSDKGLIIEANLTACEMLGRARKDLINQPLSVFIVNDDQDIFYRTRQKLLQSQKKQTCELRLKKNESVFPAQLETFVNSTLCDVPAQFLAILIDISARKGLELELQKANDELETKVQEKTIELHKTYQQLLHSAKLAAVGSLSASIAHEFNNPLQGIKSVLQGVQRRGIIALEDTELLNMAIGECNRMWGLLRSLQDFNCPSSDKKVPMDIHVTLDSLLLLGKKEFSTRKIQIEKRYAKNIPRIKAVADQIKQVFLNLLNNAADAILCEGTITLTTHVMEGNVIVRIHNTGSVISPEEKARIFESFYTTKSPGKGTGLGLTICLSIVEKHGGSITVDSEAGKGTTFSVTLPVEGVQGNQK